MSNVREFPKKYDPSKPEEFVEAYALALRSVDPDGRPTSILILEIHREDDRSVVTSIFGGADIRNTEIVGLVETWKHGFLLDELTKGEAS